MAGRIVLGLSRPSCVRSMNLLCRRSYLTAKKKISSDLEYEIHNSQVPTYEQVKNSPELQEKLVEMYESYAQDPDFHRITVESMKIGMRSLGKEALGRKD
jgi:hypothetical protein